MEKAENETESIDGLESNEEKIANGRENVDDIDKKFAAADGPPSASSSTVFCFDQL